ncbi:putative xyloglucan endotransglucosylase/hydrolase protein [Trifolium repens]|nr:putative xyloglucan endotransglucosylase/hydrolase protein [Trifolium repens]
MRRNFNSTSIQFRTQIEKKNYQKKSKKIRRSETERTERLRSGGASAAAGDRLRKMKIRVQVEVAGLCLSLSLVLCCSLKWKKKICLGQAWSSAKPCWALDPPLAMCTHKAKVIENNNFTFGLTQPQIFTLIPFFEILHMLYSILMGDQLGNSRT